MRIAISMAPTHWIWQRFADHIPNATSTIPRTAPVSGVTIGMMELLNYWGLPNLQVINRDVHVTKCHFSAPCDALECISS
jgi:hypothetical protein